ncbi:sensor histidine kinase [Paenibacillus azoreducens]|uniref:Two-component sensor histidine kinase n=1 Tax=Paenibacillus azoreducens TaxID=116718 RepID=A0A920CTB6_9BACL|nr:sensor histidine kinase [Paenibacillus azoreducens]GIO50185.1 two-component sensor histidine kinase [Paenibacillus azoreducens]
MAIGRIYRNYIKNNMFMRILLIFTFIAILTIVILSYLMFSSLSQSIINKEVTNQRAAMESVSQYIDSRYESVENLARDMYRNETLFSNITFLMEHPYNEYVQHRMDQFTNESNAYATDVLQYFQNAMDENSDIRNIMLYSSERQYLSMFMPNKQFKQLSTNVANSFIPEVMAMESKGISAPNYWVRKAAGQWDRALYAVRIPINNKLLKNSGQFLVYLDSNKISKALATYKNSYKGSIVVLSAAGNVIFDSEGKYYGKKYPYVDISDSFFDDPHAGLTESGKDMYINKLISTEGGYVVIGAVPKNEIASSYAGTRQAIITISAICILFAILFPALFVANFAKRTNRIIRFTRKVKNGDLTARIDDPREDELGQISRSFNDMLDELNLYIERVYKAEIKQKQTELVALQARINPHFLYNTLEVIRMRAISQGAKDVGEMIYSLSVLFKSLVQQKKNYTLKDELEACRLYLELFRIRYKEKFSYTIHYDPALAGRAVMKLSLQPIIENYIIHGIQKERFDNHLSIQIREEDGILIAVIADNGKGIDPQRLKEIREELEKPEETGHMFGLRSVHSRLRFLYGSAYGIEIQSRPGEGTVIIVRYPSREGTDAEHV